MNQEITLRAMLAEDYDKVRALWESIHGFAIRSIDDSRENIVRFLARNAGISVVAERAGEIVGAILCGHDGRTATFYHVCVAES
ncbi:MAG: GNAT family N-acetyltransferase, partial [Eubacterium sp.]|nr:GNAT family N-acetyltransferase [Eubacterium sp.]